MNKQDDFPEFNRRSFLKNTSFATMMAMMGGVELRAEDAAKPDPGASTPETKIPDDPTVKFGVIGLGARGREALKELAILPNTPVVAICDNYASTLRRAGNTDAPKAQRYDDYQSLLGNADVQAVVIATPTPSHLEIVQAALKAGKHIYCEAPLATTVEDTRAMAKAARDAGSLIFQPGLQERSHPERLFLLPYMRSGLLGDPVMVRAQSHRNTSWFTASSNPNHEKALNWRLHRETSSGLMGEIGIHQFDAVTWFMREKPTAVTGFGSIMHWKDGRDVADTVQGVFEFPGGVNFVYDATLCNAFDKEYEMYYGSQAAVMVRDAKAWAFYEEGAELAGWVVYARKDKFYDQTGLALTANATKQAAIGTAATAKGSDFFPLHYALKAFAGNVGQWIGETKSFSDSYGNDPQGLADYLKTKKWYNVAATWQEGMDATILGIKANEAVVKQQRIPIEKELFVL